MIAIISGKKINVLPRKTAVSKRKEAKNASAEKKVEASVPPTPAN
jgi:hypothetical protein